ncbi:hypothetical protein HDU93_008490 [Gonapodya sp. JEL0774]|nr:hypothetical protein HDU93_008490 [Gonapodya sp. JEL0774]
MAALITEDGQNRLQDAIQEKLRELGIDNDVLAQFVAVMVCNGKTRPQVEEELSTIVGDEMDVSGFCGWLFASMGPILSGQSPSVVGPGVKTEDGMDTHGPQTVNFNFDSSHATPIPVDISDSRSSAPRRFRQNRLLDMAIESAARDTGAGASVFAVAGAVNPSYRPAGRPGARVSPQPALIQAQMGGAFDESQGVINWDDSEMPIDGEFPPVPGSGPIRGRGQPTRQQPYPQPIVGAAAKGIKTPGPPPPANPLPRQDVDQLVNEPATTFTVTLNGQVIEERVETKPVRCSYWPQCKNGAQCRFWHPVELCPQWPNCPYSDSQCLYIHPAKSSIQRQNQPSVASVTAGTPGAKRGGAAYQPPRAFPNKTLNTTANTGDLAASASSGAPVSGVIPSPTLQDCMYGANCARADCKFFHPSPSAITLPRAGVGRVPMTDPRRAARCKYFPACENPDCGFYHPSPAAAKSGGPRVAGASTVDDSLMIDVDGDGALSGSIGSSSSAGLTGARSPMNGKIPVACKFVPFCTRPNCAFEHKPEVLEKLEAEKRNGAATADRKFAAEQVEERVPVAKVEGEDTVMA